MKLHEIQLKLKAPKNQRNNFGNYNYRNAEDILEAVKPLLEDSLLVITDEPVLIGDWHYIKASAKFIEGKTAREYIVNAYARESFEKKGMDSAQITGAASSYARKYALNGLFLIDDTKDADTQDNTPREAIKPYSVPRVVRPSEDEAQGKRSGEQDEVEEMLKDGIKEQLKILGKKATKSMVRELTDMEFEPQNFDAIYKKLKTLVEETDPLAKVMND